MSAAVKPELNEDVWLKVFGLLSYRDLLFSCMSVSREWRRRSTDLTGLVLDIEVKLPQDDCKSTAKKGGKNGSVEMQLTKKCKLMSNSISTYIRRRSSSLRVVSLRSKQVCLHFLLSVMAALAKCSRLTYLEIWQPDEALLESHSHHHNPDIKILHCLPPRLKNLLLSLPVNKPLRDLCTSRVDRTIAKRIDALQMLGITIDASELNSAHKILAGIYCKSAVTTLIIRNWEYAFHWLQSLSLLEYTGLRVLCIHSCASFLFEWSLRNHNIDTLVTLILEMKQLEHVSLLKLESVDGDFSTLASHPSLIQISISACPCTPPTLESILCLEKLDEIAIEDVCPRGFNPLSQEVKIPCLHPNCSLRVLLVETAGTLAVKICNVLEAKNLSKLKLRSGDLRLLSGNLSEAAHSRLEAPHFQAIVEVYGHDGSSSYREPYSTSALHWLERAGFTRRDDVIGDMRYFELRDLMFTTVMELRRTNQPVLQFPHSVSWSPTAELTEQPGSMLERPTMLAHEQEQAALWLNTDTGSKLRSLQHEYWLHAGSCDSDRLLHQPAC